MAPRDHLRSYTRNHLSALANPHVVQERLCTELAANRMLGPITSYKQHISPLGLVPKAHQANKWRLICDLSAPYGHSVNDGIPTALCSMQYATVHDAVNIINLLGRDTQLIKLDLKDAYRIVPVHPADYTLLGITWQGQLYLDHALPFGLRSAPKLFNTVADLTAWVLHCRGIQHQIHYLDDFLFLAPPNCDQGKRTRDTAATLDSLGIPVASQKTEGPTTTLTFLGILINTHTFKLQLYPVINYIALNSC